MFKDKNVATEVNRVMLTVSSMLDESVATVATSNCSQDEKTKYYKLVGRILGIIGIEVLNEVYRVHSDLKPDEYLLPEEFKKSNELNSEDKEE